MLTDDTYLKVQCLWNITKPRLLHHTGISILQSILINLQECTRDTSDARAHKQRTHFLPWYSRKKKWWIYKYLLQWSSLFSFAHRILVPWPRIEPRPLAVEEYSPNYWTAREFPWSSILMALTKKAIWGCKGKYKYELKIRKKSLPGTHTHTHTHKRKEILPISLFLENLL